MEKIYLNKQSARKLVEKERRKSIEYLWILNEWDEDESIDLKTFIRAWTKYIEDVTEFGVLNNIPK